MDFRFKRLKLSQNSFPITQNSQWEEIALEKSFQ